MWSVCLNSINYVFDSDEMYKRRNKSEVFRSSHITYQSTLGSENCSQIWSNQIVTFVLFEYKVIDFMLIQYNSNILTMILL